jgi:hypothetical protein
MRTDMRRSENPAIDFLRQSRVNSASSQVSTANPDGRSRNKSNDRGVGTAILDPGDIAQFGQTQHCRIAHVDAGATGNVVDPDWTRRIFRQCHEVTVKPILGWPRVIRTGNEIAVDRPRFGAMPCLDAFARVAAGQSKIQRVRPLGRKKFRPRQLGKTLRFFIIQSQSLTGRRGDDDAVDWCTA